jgi:glycosyltransferase involved in cell wall biosynthesis
MPGRTSEISGPEFPIRVVHFLRKPRELANFSIETVFKNVRDHLPADIQCTVEVSPFESSGILNRLKSIWYAAKRQGEINHITGDVHFLTLGMKRRKTILTIHDIGLMHYGSRAQKLVFQWFWLNLPVWKSTAITVVSEATKSELLRFVKCRPEKIRVIPTTIPTYFKAIPKDFNKDKPVVLMIGTLINKNIARMLKALEGINCRVEIIGKLSEENKRIARESGLDYQNVWNISENELLRKYGECDLLLFASVHEGFGMPIVEAQTVGRAVITSNCSSMPEVAGDAACLVDPFDIASIRKGVLKVLENETYRNKLIERGFRNSKRFDVPAVAAQYAALYRELKGKYSK